MNKWQPDSPWKGANSWRGVGFHIAGKTIRVQTKGDSDILDITRQVQELIAEAGLKNGIVTLFIQGSTAALTTMEFEAGLVEDFQNVCEKIAPANTPYKHEERWHDGNGHSHVRASLLGPSLTIPFNDSFLTLGTWQQIVVVDFDNRPRQRDIAVQIMGE